jgi:hypothetical protein
MSDIRPMASLGPTLLARKGGARPAMRPQLGGMVGLTATARAIDPEDLGWNDMGEDHHAAQTHTTPAHAAPEAPAPREVPAPMAALTLAPPPVTAPATTPVHAEMAERPEPAVKQQRRAIAEHIERQDRAGRPISRRPALEQGRRAAFTLRLDADRHLQLRLASTVTNRSAQKLLTDALDRMLADMAGIEDLAARVKRG